MAKPGVGDQGWGVALNAHLDGMESDIGGKQSAVTLAADVAAHATNASSAITKAYGRGLSLKTYGAVGDGVTNDTAAVVAWINAVKSLSSPSGFAPAGTYLVDADAVSAVLTGAKLSGEGRRRTIFKARTVGSRVFDFRESGNNNIHDLGFDGDNKAQILLDMAFAATGPSTSNQLNELYIKNQLDVGIKFDNNGDSVIARVLGGPWPDSATGIYWPNQGGNSTIIDPTLFPTSADPGPARASIECSFQNMDLRGGAVMGLKMLDGHSCQTLRASGVQFYPTKNGANLIGPIGATGLFAFVADGATKFAVHNASQTLFDGNFRYLLAARGCTFNSGATDGTPNAFSATFSGSDGTEKLRLLIEGSIIRNETGATPVTWNDTVSANVERDYQNFAGPASRNYKEVVRAGTGTSGTGLRVGASTNQMLRGIHSASVAPWGSSTVVTTGTYASAAVSLPGVAAGNGLIVEAAAALPAGVRAVAKVSSTNNVRIEVYNNSGADYTITAAAAFRVYVFQV